MKRIMLWCEDEEVFMGDKNDIYIDPLAPNDGDAVESRDEVIHNPLANIEVPLPDVAISGKVEEALEDKQIFDELGG